MDTQTRFTDWTFHYQYVLKRRSSYKNKKKTVQALVQDISEMGKTAKVIEFSSSKKYASQNVYVGDIKHARKIICTYYDTPVSCEGSYTYFDRNVQKKKTMLKIGKSTLAMIVLGLLLTFLYMRFFSDRQNLMSLSTWLWIVLFGIYFVLLAKTAKGSRNAKTVVRNTSSILALLSMILENKDDKIAFAFLDEGCYGDFGLQILKESTARDTRIYYLDSVGADAQLVAIGNQFDANACESLGIQLKKTKDPINYIIAADTFEPKYELSKTCLEAKEINKKNIEKIKELLIRRSAC